MSELLLVTRKTLEKIADRTRQMAGINEKLTLADIIYWLGRVIYIPQIHAFTKLRFKKLNIEAGGINPPVSKRIAVSNLKIKDIETTIN